MKSLLICMGVLALAGQANALRAYSIGAEAGVDPGFGPGEVSVVTFDGPNAAGVTELDAGPAGSVAVYPTTVVNVAAAPVGDATQFEAIQPDGSAKFDFADYLPGVSSLSVYVGSIDTYNMFEVSTSLGNTYFDGNGFHQNDGDEFSHLTNRRVYFLFDANEIFKSITFSASGIAFEYDTLAAEAYRGPNAPPQQIPAGSDVELLFPSQVPEPAAWATMLLGFAGVGSVVRRRRAVASA